MGTVVAPIVLVPVTLTVPPLVAVNVEAVPFNVMPPLNEIVDAPLN